MSSYFDNITKKIYFICSKIIKYSFTKLVNSFSSLNNLYKNKLYNNKYYDQKIKNNEFHKKNNIKYNEKIFYHAYKIKYYEKSYYNDNNEEMYGQFIYFD